MFTPSPKHPVTDAQRNQWAQQMRGVLALCKISDPIVTDAILRQTIALAGSAFLDGMIRQLEIENARMEEINRRKEQAAEVSA